jgi:hypothetical protein
MNATPSNPFVELSKINVTEYIEKKGQFSYLSWPFAVSQLRQFDPAATWEVKRFCDMPYMQTDLGYFVEVAVTVKGITLSQIHPILDAKNRPIPVPTAFDVNTSIQRCLVKAIALHGLGLSIYAGEDLPLVDSSEAGSAPPPLVREAAAKPPVPESANDDSRPRNSSDFLTPAQVKYITKLIAETGSDLQKVLDYFGIARIEDIARSEASRVIRSLEQRRGDERRAA